MIQASNAIIALATGFQGRTAKDAPNGFVTNAFRFVTLVGGRFAEHVIPPNTKTSNMDGVAHRAQKSLKSPS